MKKLISAAVALILIAAIAATAFAAEIKIDGEVSNGEWYGANESLFTSATSGNAVTSAQIYHCTDSNTNMVYYAFAFTMPGKGDKESIAITLNFDSAQTVTLTAASPSANTAQDPVASVNAVMSLKYYPTVYCETAVNYKNGVPSRSGGSVQFTDDFGVPSNNKSFSYSYSQPVTAQSQQNEKTTRPATNRYSYDTTRDNFNVYDFITSARTTTRRQKTTTAAPKSETTEKETKASTTKAKTTKAAKTTRAARRTATQKPETTIVYVIPETVTVTVPVTVQSAGPETFAQPATAPESAFELRGVSRSWVLKLVTAGGAAVLFGAIGIVAVRSKSDGSEEKSKNENEEE